MRLLEAHGVAMAEFDRRVRLVAADQWDAPTPCTEWSVRDLVNHLVSEQLWAPLLLRGATLDEVGDRFDGDVVGADPAAVWDEAAAAAREAWLSPGATDRRVHVSSGRMPATRYGWEMTIDLAVHAWDLAKGISADERLDPALMETLHSVISPLVNEFQGVGIFAPPVAIAEDADTQSQVLGMLGREPWW